MLISDWLSLQSSALGQVALQSLVVLHWSTGGIGLTDDVEELLLLEALGSELFEDIADELELDDAILETLLIEEAELITEEKLLDEVELPPAHAARVKSSIIGIIRRCM